MPADHPLPWPLVQLSAVAQLIRGVSFSGGESHDAPRPNHLPVLRAGNISDRLITETKLVWVPEKRVSPEQLMRPGDIAICMSSGSAAIVGKTAILETVWDGCVGAFCAIIRPTGYVDPLYLAAYLKGSQFTQWRRNQAQGANIQNLRGTELLLVPIPLPPMNEQKRIVEILQETEKIRNLRTEAETKTAELIPAMFFDHFVSGKQYEYQQLQKLADAVSGVAIGRKKKGMEIEVPYLRVANVQAGYIDLTEVKTTTATEEEADRFRLEDGDILLTEGGDFDKLGRGCLWEGQVDPCIYQNHVFRVRPFPGKLNSRFFSHYLQSARARHYFLRCAKKTTNLASINLTQLKALPVPKISIEEQEAFEEQIKIASECNSSEGTKAFDELILSLSARAFSGELTADWRDAHTAQLQTEAQERDSALKQVGATITPIKKTKSQEIEEIFELPTDGIYSDLNREQRELLVCLQQQVGGVEYSRYFSADILSKSLKGSLRKNPQAVEGHLAVFATRGLIIPVSREEQTEDTGEFVYGNTYRLPLRDNSDNIIDEDGNILTTEDGEALTIEGTIGDQSRGRELERLAAQFKKELSQSI